MDMKLIGARIKERRELLHISAEDLAERIGVHKATIHRYENGDFKSVKLPVIESIAIVLRVNPSWLIGKSEIMEMVEIKPDHDIVNIIDNTIKTLKRPDLTLDGKPIGDESKQALIDSITIGLEMARKRNR